MESDNEDEVKANRDVIKSKDELKDLKEIVEFKE